MRDLNGRLKVALLMILSVTMTLCFASPSLADIFVTANGQGGQASGSLPDSGGPFDLTIPLNKNAVNTITITAVDAYGNRASREISITQVSLDSIVVSKVTTERLSVQEVEQLVSEGVIKLDNPENYNVSKFNIVLTIANEPVPVSVPIAIPKEEKTGWETYRLPKDELGWGSNKLPQEKPEIIILEQTVSIPDLPPLSIPGVIIIEGRIKSLKEFYSVRLLLLNTSGIFTLKDVMANIEFPDGGLSKVLPADGIVSFGNILPGDGSQPGQVEKEFIIRGDEIGIRRVKVNFGGQVSGPGIPGDKLIPFNGSAFTDVEVKGPPTFNVQVTHPDMVKTNVPYELKVDITNTSDIPAMYASLELEVGADAELVKCENTNGTPSCTKIKGADIRNFGHILPGKTVSAVFTVNPLKEGYISSCVGVADQNITLRVLVGTIGCLVGQYPPTRGVPTGIPTVTVVPTPNTLGVGIDSPVTAFFSEKMNEDTITTGSGGTFNVYDRANRLIPGQIRFVIINEKTVAIWQVNDGITNRLTPEMEFTVTLTKEIKDLDGNGLFNEWNSRFTTTGMGMNDTTPPTLTLSVEPPVNPNYVLPGQIVKVYAYAADQGSGIGRVELRIKNLSDQSSNYILIDQKSVFNGNKPPYIFSVDSGNLNPGDIYQLMGTAYDGAGNAQNATISIVIAPSADPPTITLPDDPTEPVLQGISINLTPVQITGGVREVRYYLNGNTTPFKTVNLAPYQASLGTLKLTLGNHTIRAVAEDGLGQTGEDTYQFTLVSNPNMPVVNFVGSTNGANYVTGSSFVVRGEASDPVGIESVKFYLDNLGGTPIATGTAPFSINTANLTEGTHTLYIVATNLLGVSNDPNATSSVLQFNVLPLPQGPPPNPPSISNVSYPVNGQVTFSGSSVSGARIDVTNTNLNIKLSVYANSSGIFSGGISGSSGHLLSFVAFDFSTSQSPSSATSVTVPAPPVLIGITVSPTSMNFTSANAFQDITVTGHYQDGSTANLTSRATFNSSNVSIASVNSSGRVVALSSGNAVITASVDGFQAQVQVSVLIITLTHITVEPSQIHFVALNQTQQLTVRAYYSDGSSQVVTSGNSFATGNPIVATVNASGLVTAKGNGVTQVSVSRSGVTPVQVELSVNTGLDPAPTVAILSPSSGTGVESGQNISLNVRAQDEIGGVTRIYLEVSGQTNYLEMRQVSPPSLDTIRSFNFNVSNTATVGGTIIIRVWAEDTGGNSSSIASIHLNVVDQTAPSVTITQPTNHTPFNYGDTVHITISASDAVGVAQIRYQTSGALNYSGTQNFSPGTQTITANFSFNIPYGVQNPDVQIIAYARDAAGNERASIPVNIILTNADITPPETFITSVATPGSNAFTTLTYQVISGLEDLDYILLYFRRNGIGTFNRYTDADGGNPEGKYFPQSGSIGTIVFDSTKMGGDGNFEFYTVGVDKAGNREPSPKDGAGNVVPDQTVTFNAGTIWTVISTPTFIGEGDITYDDKNVRISGTTVTINGYHRFKNVELLNGAVLTHSETTMSLEYGIMLDLWTLTVDSSSSINVDGRGYLGGNREGNDCTGQTLGNINGSVYRSGGSYGGLGGVFDGGPQNSIYGSFTDPTDLGSGGSCGAWSTAGGDGGGRIQIMAINVTADGSISTNGANGGNNQAGSGSGGSIKMVTSTLSGNGLISANGGAGDVGGGGGRIAVYYIDISTKETEKIVSLGGQGSHRVGGNGTVFLRGVTETDGTLIIDGQGGTTVFTPIPIPPGYVFDNIIIRNNARVIVDNPITVNDTLKVSTNSILTHSLSSESGLVIQARRVEVDGTSSIDVSAKGYRAGYRDGNTSCSGETLGRLFGAVYRSGGSYGGYGGVYDGAGNNLPYGTPQDPVLLGAGGSCGAWSTPGGHGGGLIRIMATEAVIVEGSLLANGGNGGSNQAGSGSGGSIKIETSLLKGSGTISANGGVGDVGGGGGRVAIIYDYLGGEGEDFEGLRKISAFGGKGSHRWGSAGTVLMRRSDQAYGDLYIDDNVANATSSLYTPLVPVGPGKIVSLTHNTITVDGALKMVPNGLRGLEINPNLNQNQTYKIVSNTETAITVDISGKPDLTSIAQVGDTYAGIYRFDNVYFRRGGYLVTGDPLVVSGTMRIDEYGRLTHYDATMNYETLLDLTVGTLEITSTGSINVDARGYLGGYREGNDCTGQTLGNTDGSTYRSGGSYGGLGGSFGGSPNPTYGSLTDPAGLGSGGSCGAWSTAGGDGGGWVEINAGNLIVNGVIAANGANGGSNQAGSGSGGTIYINTSSLSGAGTIQANGGVGDVGGGGGRIAVYYDDSTFTGHIMAIGGDGSHADGQNGTVYLKKN